MKTLLCILVLMTMSFAGGYDEVIAWCDSMYGVLESVKATGQAQIIQEMSSEQVEHIKTASMLLAANLKKSDIQAKATTDFFLSMIEVEMLSFQKNELRMKTIDIKHPLTEILNDCYVECFSIAAVFGYKADNGRPGAGPVVQNP